MKAQAEIGLVLFGAHRWGKESIVEAALACNMTVYVLIPESEKSFDFSIAAGAQIIYYDANAFSFNARQFAAQMNAAHANWYVLPVDDFAMNDLQALALFWQHAPFTTSAMETCLNKHWLRTAWNGLDRTNPKLTVVPWALWKSKHAKPNKWGDNYKRNAGEFIIKPNNYSGSVGAQKIDGKETTKAVYQTFDLLKQEHLRYPTLHFKDYVITEQFIPAIKEVTVHAISINEQHEILCTAEKGTNKDTHIETSHQIPAIVDDKTQQLLQQSTLQIMQMLKLKNCMSNWEFLIQADGNIALIEGHLRPSGDQLMQLIELATGQSPYQYFFEKLQGKQVEAFATAEQTAVIHWLKPAEVLNQITDIKVPENLPKDVWLQIDEAALLSATNWPGPVDWYNRFISIKATGVTVGDNTNSGGDIAQKLEAIYKQIQLIGINQQGDKTSSGVSLA